MRLDYRLAKESGLMFMLIIRLPLSATVATMVIMGACKFWVHKISARN